MNKIFTRFVGQNWEDYNFYLLSDEKGSALVMQKRGSSVFQSACLCSDFDRGGEGDCTTPPSAYQRLPDDMKLLLTKNRQEEHAVRQKRRHNPDLVEEFKQTLGEIDLTTLE